jgi:two-component system chemotaxis sensor kinase CheA
MDRDRLLKRLLSTFLEELAENVGLLNRDLLALEKAEGKQERAECLKGLFRVAHSLKGAARSASLGPIEQFCHSLESILARVQAGGELTRDVLALLFSAADALEEVGMRLREQQDLTGSPLVEMLPRLAALCEEATAPADESAAPVAPPSHSTDKKPVSVERPPAVVDRPMVPLGEQGGSVRVPAEKLNAFLGRSGALLVARRRVQSRVDDLAALHDDVSRWRNEWEPAGRTLPALLQNATRSAPRRWPTWLIKTLEEVGDRVGSLEERLDWLERTLADDVRALKESATALEDEVRRVRMLPFADACAGLDRMVRDLAQAAGKEVELVVEGSDVELDRSVLDGLRDPLRHLVRNAVDHGAESPAERRAAGKSATARVRVAAVLRGAQVEVTVADDGRGLDVDALRRQLHKRGLPVPADDRELSRTVFLPGLSTSRLITDVSGRGVGLDVVKSRVEALHGAINLNFTPGGGTRFALALPLTLTTLRALLVTANGQTFAFADTVVQRLVRVDSLDVRCIEGREMLTLGGPPMPVVSLAEILGLPGGAPRKEGKRLVVVIAAGEGRMAFVVDELLTEQEIVVKGLGSRIRRLRHVSGATLLPNGAVALVLNAANLIRTALATKSPGSFLTPAVSVGKSRRRRLLVVDDSVTTRTLEKSILEAAGYEVTVAADGSAAWQLLQERSFDLLVSDVEMPRMDGFALTEAVRGSRKLSELPVVLVTARATPEDQARGLTAGANAYLLKCSFDQTNLLETITQLL